MESVYSRVDETLLLHRVARGRDACRDRVDLSPDAEFMQVAHFALPAGRRFQAHRHLVNVRRVEITQESWVVVHGRIRATLYDIDGSLLRTVILESGDCSITYRGGHGYESLEEGTLVYEFKTGPYFGRDQDKEPLSE